MLVEGKNDWNVSKAYIFPVVTKHDILKQAAMSC